MDQSPWIELHCQSALANTAEDIGRNIEACLARGGYIPFHEIMGNESGAVSIVGSGPSLKKNWHKLKKFKGDIIACNAAFQFLLERGITPKFMFSFDADPLMLEFITPVKGVTYLMGSRTPQKAFDMLDGCKVVVFHANGDPGLEEILQKHNKMEAMLAGGTAAVTRCMYLAPAMGYTTIHLWGCDSSFSGEDTHIRKSTTVEKLIPIMISDRVFMTAPWMCQQAEDFKILSPTLRDIGMRLIVHGDGMIPWIAKLMHFEVDNESKVLRFFSDVAKKSRILWQQL